MRAGCCAGVIDLFPSFLQMTKKIKKLEKETAMYRSRWESSNKALLEMAEEVKNMEIFITVMQVLDPEKR